MYLLITLDTQSLFSGGSRGVSGVLWNPSQEHIHVYCTELDSVSKHTRVIVTVLHVTMHTWTTSLHVKPPVKITQVVSPKVNLIRLLF